jgi:hypothetical protein
MGFLFARRPLTRLLVAAILAAMSGCCGGTSPDYLTFEITGTTPRWGETMTAMGIVSMTAEYTRGKTLQGEPLELYQDDLRVDVPETTVERDNSTVDGCGFSTVITYDVSALAAGSYQLVHRRSAGTGDALNCIGDCPWTTFDGDAALVLTLDLQ